MLLGAAQYLAETRNFGGTVHFIFQPAEEDGGGGGVMVEEGLFKSFHVTKYMVCIIGRCCQWAKFRYARALLWVVQMSLI